MQQAEPTQQVAAFQVEGLAEVESEILPTGFGGQFEAALFTLEILLEWHTRRLGGHAAHPLVENQLLVDQAHRPVVAEAEDGATGFVQFGQARQGVAA